MAGADQQVIINMTPQTITALNKSGFVLYGFKAVQCSDKAGRPLVWFQTQSYSAKTTIMCSDQFQAYTSSSPLAPGGQIDIGFAVDMLPGQILSVEVGGAGDVSTGGVATALSILNTSHSPFTCGISQMCDGNFDPCCAFPLYGGDLQIIAPTAKILLMFSTMPLKTSATVEQAYGPGILIDLSSDDPREVSYDINQNWSWEGYAWAQSVPAYSQLVPLLIEPSAYLAVRRASLLRKCGIRV